MKNEKSAGRTYVCLGGGFFLRYMYFDLNEGEGYVADSLFYKRKIRVKFKDEMIRDGDKYRAIFCRIRKKDKAAFEEALEEIGTKMSLLGHNDYDGYCARTLAEIGEA